MHGETNAQSTGIHAALLAPRCITMWRHQDGTSHHRRQDSMALLLPAFDPSTTAVFFPESSTTPVVDLWGQLVVPQSVATAALAEASAIDVNADGSPKFARSKGHVKGIGWQLGSEQSTSVSVERNGGCSSSDSYCFSYFREVVVLEGNWAKARGLLPDPCIAPLPRVGPGAN